jgi:hypothetical protein
MTKTLIFALFLGLSPAFGQETTPQPTPASKEDIQELEFKIQQMNAKHAKAMQEAANLSKADRDALITQQEEERKAYRALHQEMLDSIRRQGEKADGDRLRYERSQRYTIGISAGLILICAFIVFMARKSKNAKRQSEPQVPTIVVQKLYDPTISELWEYSEKYGTKTPPFTLPTDDGREFSCIATLTTRGVDPEIDYVGTGWKCKDWRRRYSTAKKIPPQAVKTA